jgi:hypothetical protein
VSRVLDDRGRLFGKINVVDLVVLLVIVAVVVFAAVRLTGGSPETVPVKLFFTERGVDRSLVSGLQSKGTVKDAGGNVIGEVQSVESTPTLVELVTPAGELKTFASALRRDVTIVVLGKGTVSDSTGAGSTVHIGKLAARVGAEVKLIGPGYEAQTTITKVVWGAEALQ